MRVAIALLAAVAAACVATSKEPIWSPAKVAPARWIQGFDYKTDLVAHLRGQYDSARLEGATAYVYFYSDSNSHCLGTRRMMSLPEVAPVLENVRMTLLNADRLRWLHDQGDENIVDPGKWLPIIAKIAADGTLESGIFLPDLALYHQDATKIHPTATLIVRRDKERVRRFVEELQHFFQLRNEI